MDQEAQEKIGVEFCGENEWDYYTPWGRKTGDIFALKILHSLQKLGYRKLPKGEPPLLSREDINGSPELFRAYIKNLKKHSYTMANRATQRDSDIKWMRGE